MKHEFPHRSPWKVLLISDRVGALIESNIITSLNEPCAIKDVSWIKPGTATFPWWNGTIIPEYIKGGNNFETLHLGNNTRYEMNGNHITILSTGCN